MKKSDFKIIEGGAPMQKPEDYRFVRGEATNTRLMGVVGMHLHWQYIGGGSPEDLQQFWYYDFEEYGLDTFTEYPGNDPEIQRMTILASFGGLGGDLVEISERESRFLAKYFIDESKKMGARLPDNLLGHQYITDVPSDLTSEEQFTLWKDLCVKLKTDYAAINYYMMRELGHDEGGKALLKSPLAPPANFRDIAPKGRLSLLLNDIEPFTDQNGTASYLCKSLIEKDKGHSLIFSELKYRDGLILSAEKKDEMNVSPTEASMMLSRPEYVAVYDTFDPLGDLSSLGIEESFEVDFGTFAIGMTNDSYEAGEMFIEYKRDNSHVDKPNYRLNDDVSAMYFLSDGGQLLVGAYCLEDAVASEIKLRKSSLWSLLEQKNKYLFHDALLLDFANSGYPDFDEFLSAINARRP